MSADALGHGARTVSVAISLALGAGGGWIAARLGMPMPWLLGAMLSNALWVIFLPGRLNTPVAFPEELRRIFIVVIAVMIGGTFTPELVQAFPKWWPSFAAMILFTLVCQVIAYTVFRRVAKLDRPTAYFSALPGGLVESVMLGEEAGGNAQIIALLHFVRLTLVISIIPFGFSLWVGHTVGSAAGVTLGTDALPLTAADTALLVGAGAAGYVIGKLLRIPAGVIVVPILFSGAIHMAGLTDGRIPSWVGTTAQVIVGSGIGVRFSGIKLPTIARAFSLCLVTVTLMLALAFGLAMILGPATDISPEIYLISFAPAGVIEMSLIALTLEANPVFVTTHHVVRVFATIGLIPLAYHRWLAKPNTTRADS